MSSLEISIRKRWQRRIYLLWLCGFMLLLCSLIPRRFHPPPYSLPFALIYVPLFLLVPLLSQLYATRTQQGGYGPVVRSVGWPRKYTGPLPARAMDERDIALRDIAHVWAYNVLYISLVAGIVIYLFSDARMRQAFTSLLPAILMLGAPFLSLLPYYVSFWMEPDWLEDHANSKLTPAHLAASAAFVLYFVLEFHTTGFVWHMVGFLLLLMAILSGMLSRLLNSLN
jgi:hypothetical protein